ncbi:nuclear transport factor 2 family protein [Nocardia tengchongensis]|uniref:nuclear transport factor 2 family protein n=1 Tax=Nocardia tengchongensis TaxID=2055889 RepID=UPI0036185596
MDAIEAIRRLKYRYLRALDLKDWALFAGTLTEDVTADYGDRLSFTNRTDLVAKMSESLPASIITVHQCHHPEIDIDGDTATGIWYLSDTVIFTETRQILTGAAFYEDRYRRDADGEWRISRTGYTRTYEAMQSLDDTPTWQLLAHR